jgi:hypothetical protein
MPIYDSKFAAVRFISNQFIAVFIGLVCNTATLSLDSAESDPSLRQLYAILTIDYTPFTRIMTQTLKSPITKKKKNCLSAP